jgi:hypothetical protein
MNGMVSLRCMLVKVVRIIVLKLAHNQLAKPGHSVFWFPRASQFQFRKESLQRTVRA